eukprot:TRINITY_DN43782_c0_g1_i1.p1 TRINITY_DN43782_c0_g1~~TRINITY_DN43782_c0_g1_i1.p1  ORF type:complete len:362 (-),score=50.61 TRINITY_DN43782_c0_g1_i1:129-1214(-)
MAAPFSKMAPPDRPALQFQPTFELSQQIGQYPNLAHPGGPPQHGFPSALVPSGVPPPGLPPHVGWLPHNSTSSSHLPGPPPLDVGGFLLPLPFFPAASGGACVAQQPGGLNFLDSSNGPDLPCLMQQVLPSDQVDDNIGGEVMVFGPAPNPSTTVDVVSKAPSPKPPAHAPPPWVPPWAAAAANPNAAEGRDTERKRRKVEGLAPSKNIASGGAVTVYSGYSAVTTAGGAKASETASQKREEQGPTGSLPQAGVVSTTAQALPRQLPEGWEMRKSRSTGKVYYVNEKLGKSQFDLPAGSTLKVEAKKKQKLSLRAKDGPVAHATDKNGVAGIVRATEQKLGRWQKWQKTSRLINAPSPEKE